MNILVATDGTLDTDQAAAAVARLYREGDDVVVYTAVNFPREFLNRLSESGVKEASDIALAAGHQLGSGDRAAERLAHTQAHTDPAPATSPVAGVLEATARGRTDPVVAALAEHNVAATSAWSTTENRTANSIMAYARQHDADVIVIGSHGRGRFEGVLGSTGTKLVRLAPASVLVLRNEG